MNRIPNSLHHTPYFYLCTIVLLLNSTTLASDSTKEDSSAPPIKISILPTLEKEKQASIIAPSIDQIFENDQNSQNLKQPIYIPRSNTTSKDYKTPEKKNKNWLEEDLKKFRQIREERLPKEEKENTTSQQEISYRKTDIFSLGINQPTLLPLSSTSTIEPTKSPQIPSIHFIPAYSSDTSTTRNLEQLTNTSPLNIPLSIDTHPQNNLKEPSHLFDRKIADSALPTPTYPDDLTTDFNLDPPIMKATIVNDILPQLRPSEPFPTPSIQTNQNFNYNFNPINPTTPTIRSNNLSDLSNPLLSAPATNPFAPSNINIQNLLDSPRSTSPKVLGNPNLNPDKISDPLERYYR